MELVSARSRLVTGVLALGIALAGSGCKDGSDLVSAPRPADSPNTDSPGSLFFDDFEDGQLPKWEPTEGLWDLRSARDDGQEYGSKRKDYALSVAGAANWTDYTVEAQVTIHDDRHGPAGLAGRLQSSHFHYELLLGRGDGGAKSWLLRQRLRHGWTTLASGPYDYELGTPQILRLAFKGRRLEGSVSRNGGRSFLSLGAADVIGPSHGLGPHRSSELRRRCHVRRRAGDQD